MTGIIKAEIAEACETKTVEVEAERFSIKCGSLQVIGNGGPYPTVLIDGRSTCLRSFSFSFEVGSPPVVKLEYPVSMGLFGELMKPIRTIEPKEAGWCNGRLEFKDEHWGRFILKESIRAFDTPGFESVTKELSGKFLHQAGQELQLGDKIRIVNQWLKATLILSAKDAVGYDVVSYGPYEINGTDHAATDSPAYTATRPASLTSPR